MTEWDIVVVITALVGLGAGIIGPVVKLTRAITTLNVTVIETGKRLTELKTDNTASHKRLWDRCEELDARLSRVEHKQT